MTTIASKHKLINTSGVAVQVRTATSKQAARPPLGLAMVLPVASEQAPQAEQHPRPDFVLPPPLVPPPLPARLPLRRYPRTRGAVQPTVGRPAWDLNGETAAANSKILRMRMICMALAGI